MFGHLTSPQTHGCNIIFQSGLPGSYFIVLTVPEATRCHFLPIYPSCAHLWLKWAAHKNIKLSTFNLNFKNSTPLYFRVAYDKLSALLKRKIEPGSMLLVQATMQMTELCKANHLTKLFCFFLILNGSKLLVGNNRPFSQKQVR